MKKVVVTGGAGFIGSHLVHGLLRRGCDVTIFDNFSTGRRENLKGITKDVSIRKADIRDLPALKRACRSADTLFHLAAVSSVPYSVDFPIETTDVNIGGTMNVLDAARVQKVKRVVFVSSASVYGAHLKVPFRESMAVQGSSPYAASKLIGEQLCNLYNELYGLETVALRFFSVFGPRQNPYSQYANVIPAFVTRLLQNMQPTIYGDGKQTRDFVSVDDIVRAFIAAATRKNAPGHVMNIGSGKETSVNELLRQIQKVMGTTIEPYYAPAKPGDDPKTCANSKLAGKILGLKKYKTLQQGLKPTVDWFTKNFKPTKSSKKGGR